MRSVIACCGMEEADVREEIRREMQPTECRSYATELCASWLLTFSFTFLYPKRVEMGQHFSHTTKMHLNCTSFKKEQRINKISN